jgi:signal transduction histidine kinase/CheY-like chemotaxis protein
METPDQKETTELSIPPKSLFQRIFPRATHSDQADTAHGHYASAIDDSGMGFILFHPEDGSLVDANDRGIALLGIGSENSGRDNASVFDLLAHRKFKLESRVYHSLKQVVEASSDAASGAYREGAGHRQIILSGHFQESPDSPEIPFTLRMDSRDSRRRRHAAGHNHRLASLTFQRPESREITRLREQHEMLTRAVETGGIAFFHWNPIAGNLYASSNLPQIRGLKDLTPPGSIQDLMESIHPDDRHAWWNHFEGKLHRQPGGGELQFRVRNAGSDPPWRWIRELIWGSWTHDGRCRELFAVNIDITESKNRESELRSARDLAEASNRSKNEFLANMSHEIRTPLNAILGFADIIINESQGEAIIQYARTIGRSGRQLLGMLDNILTLAKIEAGRLKVADDEFSVFSIRKELELTHRSSAEKKGLNFTVAHDQAIPATMISDREKIMRILSRLVENAIKFTETGSVSVDIYYLAGQSDREGMMQVVIEDEGIGMDPDDLENLKSMFTQARADSTRKYGGTGLGLTISSRLLELLGGSMNISACTPRGTRFDVNIPVRLGQTASGTSGWIDDDPALRKILAGKRVLSVDDSDSNQLLIGRILAKFGTEHFQAPGGREGIIRFGECHPDILLMDINMPDLDGWSCIEEIRRSFPESLGACKLIMLSGHDPDEYSAQRESYGVDGFLTKPFDINGLLRTLSRLFAGEVIEEKRASGERNQGAAPGESADQEPDALEPAIMADIIAGSYEYYQRAVEKMRLQDIIAFASRLQEKSQDYLASTPYRLSNKLIRAVERFDIDEMKQLMDRYGTIASSHRSAEGESGDDQT